MLPAQRARALRLLAEARPADLGLARDVEAACHALAHSADEYGDHVRRAAFNLHANPALGREVVDADEDALTRGVLVGRIRDETRARAERFERMLQEKYDALNEGEYTAIVRCRRCGSTEVAWEEKQTRSADEGGTLFCACTTCKNRWVVR